MITMTTDQDYATTVSVVIHLRFLVYYVNVVLIMYTSHFQFIVTYDSHAWGYAADMLEVSYRDLKINSLR